MKSTMGPWDLAPTLVNLKVDLKMHFRNISSQMTQMFKM